MHKRTPFNRQEACTAAGSPSSTVLCAAALSLHSGPEPQPQACPFLPAASQGAVFSDKNPTPAPPQPHPQECTRLDATQRLMQAQNINSEYIHTWRSCSRATHAGSEHNQWFTPTQTHLYQVVQPLVLLARTAVPPLQQVVLVCLVLQRRHLGLQVSQSLLSTRLGIPDLHSKRQGQQRDVALQWAMPLSQPLHSINMHMFSLHRYQGAQQSVSYGNRALSQQGLR